MFPARADRSDRWSISVSTHIEVERGEGQCDPCRRRGLEEQLVTSIESVIPDVRDRLLLLRSATPQTFERFTSRPGGFVGGLRQFPSVVAFRAPGHRPAKGLFMAGDHVFPGQGTVGTALSGINAYRDAAEFLRRRAIL
jgi:phytoene dehydrogenase-like protein